MKGNQLKTKLVAMFIVLTMLVSSGFALMSFSSTNASSNGIDVSKINGLVEVNLEKYVNYNVESKKGTLVQLDVKNGIQFNEGEEYVPLTASGVLINTPQINGEFPESVEVIPCSTLLTNGSNQGKDFVKEYDSSTGIIKIVTNNNPDEDGNIYMEQKAGAKDNYKLILNYSSNCYAENEARTLTVSGLVQNKLYSEEDIKVKTDISRDFEVEGNISGLVNNNIVTTPIYNGYIKSNALESTEYETNYNENFEIIVSQKEISDELTFDITNDFEENKNVYKTSTFNVNNVQNVLGENGTLKVLNQEGNEVAQINKDTVVDENGNYTVQYDENTTKISLKMSKPQNVGIIKVQNSKKIIPDFTNLVANKFVVTSKMKATNNVKVQDKETNEEKIETKDIYSFEDAKEIEIAEAKTEVRFTLDNKEWTNEKQNDVNFNIDLLTSENRQNLFNNPVIEIHLPEQVEKVNLEEATLAYGNGITLKETTYDEEAKVIRLILEGEQKEYLSKELAEGTNIVVPAKILVNKDIETTDDVVSLTYINNKTLESGELTSVVNIRNYQERQVNDIQNVGMIRNFTAQAASLDNVQVTAEGIELKVLPTVGGKTLNNEEEVHEGEFIKYVLGVKNTTDHDIENVTIKTQIPEGAVFAKYNSNFDKLDVQSSYEFQEAIAGSTINIGTLKAGKNKTTYYELKVLDLAEGEAEKNITSKVVAFVGEDAAAQYEITNKVVPADYSVTATASRRGEEGFNINLHIEDKANKGENVRLKINLPEELSFELLYIPSSREEGNFIAERKVEEGTNGELVETRRGITDDNVVELMPGDYMLYATLNKDKSLKLSGEDYENLYSNFIINDTYRSNELLTTYYYKSVAIEMTSETEGENINYDDEIVYNIKIENTSRIDYSDYNPQLGAPIDSNAILVSVKDYLPENVKPISIKYNKFAKVEPKEGQDPILFQYTEEEKTEDIKNVISSADGTKKANVDLDLTIPYGKTVEIEVKAKAGHVYRKTEVNNFATLNEIQFTYEKMELDSAHSRSDLKITDTNTVTHTILPYGYEEDEENPDDPINPDDPSNPDDPTNPDDPSNPDKPDDPSNPDKPDDPSNPDENKKYSITGLAWNDINEDGKKDSNEVKLSGIEVVLLNSDGNSVKAVKTNNNGEYTFEDIKAGKYVVAFKYNANKYRLTEYKKSGVSDTENSDAMSRKKSIDGKEIVCGVTDIIDLVANKSHIDIGLIENKAFNFKIDKYISKVTVRSGNQNKETVYGNSKLAKTEIRSKEINGATVVVEYKIVVTNTGELEGKVTSVIDRIPSELKFSSELSKSWAKNSDGTLINNSLSNETIQPGQSRELTLILTKSMTSNSTGTFTNEALIGSVSNDSNVAELNANDNSSKADLIISISTGETIIYISIIVGIIGVVALLVFLNIKFKIFKKLKIFGFVLVVLFIGVSQISTNSNAFYQGQGFLITWGGGAEEFVTWSGGYQWWCQNYAIWDPVTQIWKYVSDMRPDGNYSNNPTSYSDEYNWRLEKTDEGKVKARYVGDNIVIGPLGINSNADKTWQNQCDDFVFTITNADGSNTKTVSVVCDENGENERTTNATGVYYLKVPKSEFENGISKVEVTSGINYIVTKTETYLQKTTITNGQPLATWTPERKEITETEKKNDGLEWIIDTANLLIVKTDEIGTDEDGNPLDLSGIKFIINKEGEGWLKKDKEGNYYPADFDDEQGELVVLTTDNEGRTETIEGIDSGSYAVYEIIEGGDYSLPERLKEYYKETVDGRWGCPYKLKLFGKGENLDNYKKIKQGQTYEFSAENKRDFNKLKLRKIDESGQSLQAVKFKIKDKEADKWVKWKKVHDDKTNTDKYVVDGLTEEFNKNDSLSTLITLGSEGYTEVVEKFEVGRQYEIYEVDLGPYGYIYEIGHENGGTEEGLLVDTFTMESNKECLQLETVTNIPVYGSLTIDKKVKNTDIKLPGFGFKIKANTKDGSKWLKFEEKDHPKKVETKVNERVGYTDSFDEATTIYTLADGKTWDLVKLVAEGYTYDVYEVEIPESHRGYFAIPESGVLVATNEEEAYKIGENLTVEAEFEEADPPILPKVVPYAFENEQTFIDLSGNVWEEVAEQRKNDNTTNTYLDDNDRKLNGIPVRLIERKTGTIIQETITQKYEAEDGNDLNGHYKFTQVKIADLPNYIIEFTYDGITYQCVVTPKDENPPADVKSIATENNTNRADLNNAFGEVTGEDQIIEYNGKEVKLTYNKKNEYVYSNNISDRAERLEEIMNSDSYTNVLNLTKQGDLTVHAGIGGLDSYYKDQLTNSADSDGLVYEVKNLNMGLDVRSMPDLSVRKDVQRADVSVNGKTFTYVYGKKDGEELTTVGVAFERNMLLSEDNRYLLPVYRADVTDYTGSDPFKVTVTYKIALINNNPILYNKVNAIDEYFSSKYSNMKVYEGTKDVRGSEISASINKLEDVKDGNRDYTHYRVSDLNMIIPPSKSSEENVKYLYVELQINREVAAEMLSGSGEVKAEDFYNMVEIASYSTFTDSDCKQLYAGFDVDSIPGNVYRKYNIDPKQEDDTDSAPALRMKESTARSISGIVFEDKADEGKLQAATGKVAERIGNGIYDNGEHGIDGVTVILQDVNNESNSKTVETKDGGKFTIDKFYASDYKLIYKWGDESYTEENGELVVYNPTKYKSTIINSDYINKLNGITDNRASWWYQNEYQSGTRYSEAIDLATKRYNIDSNTEIAFEDIEGVKAAELDDEKMESTTEDLSIEIDVLAKDDNFEVDNEGFRTYFYNIDNIDFGIIERPRQGLQITKDLTHLTIKDEYGTIIVDTDVENGQLTNPDVKYTVYVPKSSADKYGQVKVELDNEYLPATVVATYSITVTNSSEQDYYNYKNEETELSNYYKFGIVNPDTDREVTLKPVGVYDYVTESFVLDDTSEGEVITREEYVEKVSAYAEDRTIIEEGYETVKKYLDDHGATIEQYNWKTPTEQVSTAFNEWLQKDTVTSKTAREHKLDKAKIIDLSEELSEKELKPGESVSATILGSNPITSTDVDAVLQNKAEITNVERTHKYGSIPFSTYTTFYDEGERFIVTPPTGENKDNTVAIIIAITSSVALVAIGVGIVLIKKKVLGANK